MVYLYFSLVHCGVCRFTHSSITCCKVTSVKPSIAKRFSFSAKTLASFSWLVDNHPVFYVCVCYFWCIQVSKTFCQLAWHQWISLRRLIASSVFRWVLALWFCCRWALLCVSRVWLCVAMCVKSFDVRWFTMIYDDFMRYNKTIKKPWFTRLFWWLMTLKNIWWFLVILIDGGDGGSWTRVRQHYAHDSTYLESVYGFNPHRTDSQVGLDDLLRVHPTHRNAASDYPLCIRIGVSNQTKGNLCRPKQPLGC